MTIKFYCNVRLFPVVFGKVLSVELLLELNRVDMIATHLEQHEIKEHKHCMIEYK